MIRFVLAIILIGVAALFPIITRGEIKSGVRGMISSLLLVFGLILGVFSTSLYVSDSESGLIIRKFGVGLQEGRIIAINGERGVQADILSPGWSFGYWPWLYDKVAVKATLIPDGQVGIVTALDGCALPEGEIYGQAWASPSEMLDAKKFLSGKGTRGQQLTVLPPGLYRYNTRLFSVSIAPITDVKIGYGAVVRANAGRVANTNEVKIVDGVQLVPKGCKGMWNEALPPGQYFLHPAAYEIITARTSKRMYSYTSAQGSDANTVSKKEPEGDNSVLVRTMDGYQIPCDVRTGISISLADLPQLIARIPKPDMDDDKDGFDNLEEIVVLPAIRALLRNTSEKQEALKYIGSRSEVEKAAGAAFTVAMLKNKITVDEFYLADLNLNHTPQGEALLKTQTDSKLAMESEKLYGIQVTAETKRGEQVKAMATADMQKSIQESLTSVEVEKNKAEAAKLTATGKAAESLIYEAKVKAMGGTEAMTKLEMMKLTIEMLPQAMAALKGMQLPQILVVGGGDGKTGGGDVTTALLASLTQALRSEPTVEKKK